MLAVEIRRATESDFSILMQMEEECFGTERFSPEIVQAFVSRDDAFVILASEGGEYIGSAMCTVSLPHREGRVASIAVVQRMRRRGIGTALLGACETAFHEHGLTRFTLEVDVSNKEAISLYTKRGYEIKAMLQDFYGQGRHGYYMEKSVDRSRRTVPIRSV